MVFSLAIVWVQGSLKILGYGHHCLFGELWWNGKTVEDFEWESYWNWSGEDFIFNLVDTLDIWKHIDYKK